MPRNQFLVTTQGVTVTEVKLKLACFLFDIYHLNTFNIPCDLDRYLFLSSACIQDQLKKMLSVAEKELFSRCSAPWISNITYGILYNYSSLEACNKSDAILQSISLANFFFKATWYDILECKGNNYNFFIQHIWFD